MKKEYLNAFDLEAAFKALDELETPAVKGIKPNRENLQEKFTKKLSTDILVEDYYDINDTAELEKAQEDREAEIAKAKLARIEKIVDLEAESEEDLLPSYVGKYIMQCPQCMTLFYKNQEDVETSEENPEVVNINEVCQHCGNTSGYTLIGKVGSVGEDEAEDYDLDAFSDDELNLDFPEEGTEEVDPEGTGETAADEEELELDLEPLEDIEDEEEKEESDEEEKEVKESLRETVEETAIEEETNEEVKIAGFVDCSGSHGKDSIKNQINILKNAGVTEIYYFSDKVYTTPESAWQGGKTVYSGIRDWVETNPKCKAIVTTDSDVESNDGHKIKNHERIEIIRIDTKESLAEALYSIYKNGEYIGDLNAESEKDAISKCYSGAFGLANSDDMFDAELADDLDEDDYDDDFDDNRYESLDNSKKNLVEQTVSKLSIFRRSTTKNLTESVAKEALTEGGYETLGRVNASKGIGRTIGAGGGALAGYLTMGWGAGAICGGVLGSIIGAGAGALIGWIMGHKQEVRDRKKVEQAMKENSELRMAITKLAAKSGENNPVVITTWVKDYIEQPQKQANVALGDIKVLPNGEVIDAEAEVTSEQVADMLEALQLEAVSTKKLYETPTEEILPVEDETKEVPEEEILTTVSEIKEVATEVGNLVAEEIKENPEIDVETIENIATTVVETKLLTPETEEEVDGDKSEEPAELEKNTRESLVEVNSSENKEKDSVKYTKIGMGAGAAAGAVGGAALGSAIAPGVGTAIGGVLGTGIGMNTGASVGAYADAELSKATENLDLKEGIFEDEYVKLLKKSGADKSFKKLIDAGLPVKDALLGAKLGMIPGTVAGAVHGATMGSAIAPGIGTAVGGVYGAGAGLLAGAAAGAGAGSLVGVTAKGIKDLNNSKDKKEEKEETKESLVESKSVLDWTKNDVKELIADPFYALCDEFNLDTANLDAKVDCVLEEMHFICPGVDEGFAIATIDVDYYTEEQKSTVISVFEALIEVLDQDPETRDFSCYIDEYEKEENSELPAFLSMTIFEGYEMDLDEALTEEETEAKKENKVKAWFKELKDGIAQKAQEFLKSAAVIHKDSLGGKKIKYDADVLLRRGLAVDDDEKKKDLKELSGVLGMFGLGSMLILALLVGPAGLALGAGGSALLTQLLSNEVIGRDPKIRELIEYAKTDVKVSEILEKIKVELAQKHPNEQILKGLNVELEKELIRVKKDHWYKAEFDADTYKAVTGKDADKDKKEALTEGDVENALGGMGGMGGMGGVADVSNLLKTADDMGVPVKPMLKGGVIGMGAGTIGGALAGAAKGSAIAPGVGTAIGGALGGAAGLAGGVMAGTLVGGTLGGLADIVKKDNKPKKEEKKVEETLVEADLLNTVLDSEEFNEPISDEEVRGILNSTKFHENLNFTEVEDLHEESFNNHIGQFLKEVYSNVATFNATECRVTNSNLIVEGIIKFNSGKEKPTSFVFESINNTLVGTNEDLTTEKAFTINYNIQKNSLITESLSYKYTIKNTLVEGLIK